MQKVLLILLLVMFFCLPAAAQEYPKRELFGGYSYLRGNDLNFNGWNVSLVENFNRYAGLKIDFSGHYNTKEPNLQKVQNWVHNILIGPQITIRESERVTPFFHGMIGLSVSSVRVNLFGMPVREHLKNFAAVAGGGVDIRLSENVSFRPVQVDWLYVREQSTTANSLRASLGFVYRF